jgi:molybdopterin-binding protein
MKPRHRFVAAWLGVVPALGLIMFSLSAQARLVTDATGRQVAVPDRVERVYPAGPPASVLLYVLAPSAMLGWAHGPGDAAKAFLEPPAAALPELGALTHGDTVDTAAIGRLHPRLIVDFGTVSPRYAELAAKVQATTGVPYPLLDGRLEKAGAAVAAPAVRLGRRAALGQSPARPAVARPPASPRGSRQRHAASRAGLLPSVLSRRPDRRRDRPAACNPLRRRRTTMKISARNRFAGTITQVKKGAVMAQVTVDIGGGNIVTSAIFVDSAEDLDLKVGDKVSAVIKSTDVMIFRD